MGSAETSGEVPRVSFVVPVFQSTETLGEIVSRANQACIGRYAPEIIFVEDGSGEAPWLSILDLAKQHSNVRGIRLSRNFGQHAALLAGIRAARGSLTVTLDDDLQNPPEEAIKLIDHLLANDLDVVYGVSNTRVQAPWRRWGGSLIRVAVLGPLRVRQAAGLSSFRAFRTDLRESFGGHVGSGISIDALLDWASGARDVVRVREDPRAMGVSSYTLTKLLRYAVDVTTGYSVRPLQLASVLGLASGFLSLLLLVSVLARWVIYGSSVPGFVFLACTISFFASVQLVTLGVMGEYIARMHFRVMGRPTYHIRDKVEG